MMGPDRDRFLKDVEDVARAIFRALFATVAAFTLHMDKVDLEIPVLLWHVDFP